MFGIFIFIYIKFAMIKDMSLSSFINEKLKINKDYKEAYSQKPATAKDLRKIIEDRLEKQGCGTIKEPINLNDIDVSEIDNLENVFYYIGMSYKIKAIDISDWDVSHVTSFKSMFADCSSLQYVGNLSKWDVSECTNFTAMFNDCKFLKNIGDISKWKMTKANDVHSMFSGCKRLENIGDVGQWDVSNVKDFSFIFESCEKLKPIDLNNWKIHNDVTGKNVRMLISGTSGWKMPKWYFDVRKR